MKKKFCIFTSVAAVLTILFLVLYKIKCAELLFTLFITSLTFFYHGAIRLIIGGLIGGRKNTNYNPKSFWFRQKPFEKKLYAKIKVKQWKSKVPSWNPDGFSFEKNTPEQILQNMCTSELVHEANVPASFLSLLLCFLCDKPSENIAVFLITAIIASCFDMVFVILQRYNRERVLHLFDHKRYKSK